MASFKRCTSCSHTNTGRGGVVALPWPSRDASTLSARFLTLLAAQRQQAEILLWTRQGCLTDPPLLVASPVDGQVCGCPGRTDGKRVSRLLTLTLGMLCFPGLGIAGARRVLQVVLMPPLWAAWITLPPQESRVVVAVHTVRPSWPP